MKKINWLTQFKKQFPKEYSDTKRQGFLERLCIDMGWTPKISKERVLTIARNYKGNHFKKDHPSEYQHAMRHGYILELREIVSKAKTSKERVLTIAINYKGTRFKKDYPSEYNHARRHKYLSELNEILKNIKEVLLPPKLSKERTLIIGKGYKGSFFQKDYPAEYGHARRYRYINELREILPIKKNNHSKERTFDLARNYKGSHFRKDYQTEYNTACRKGYLPELNEILQYKH